MVRTGNEAVARSITGKETVSITRGSELVTRADSSNTVTGYGFETTAAADGSQTIVSKKVIATADKFALGDTTTASRTETKIAADKIYK